ncbi:hypothetical protein BsWGS_11196 [Bradybaena similaris]
MSQANVKQDIRKAIKAFISHVESLENAENPDENGFEAEYKLIQEAQAKNRRENAFPMDVGKTENNLKKNRYKDILPYDEHRVVLSILDDDQDSDYINASKLMGVRGTGGYIATQGPLATTVNDFWRMIWEYSVEIIFMACRIVELGKIKCKQYWNDVDKSEEFGDITVMTEFEESIMFDCMLRKFRVARGEEVRYVVQFHYSGWPDHGIPDDAGHIRDMIGKMRQMRHNIQAPLVVHCSAGCGRSGAIITIDYVWTLLEEGKFDDTFSLFDLICDFREQRMSIVQTADQYALVNKVLKTLCEEWLTKMATHTYENVDVDQACDTDGKNTDVSMSASGEQLDVGGHSSGNHVHDGVPGLRPIADQKHVEGSNRPPVSPIKKKPAALTAYENILQNEGKNQNLAEKGSQKSVTQIEPTTKLSSPGSKKSQAPSPPSSPPDSDPKGGYPQPPHLQQVHVRAALPSTPSRPSDIPFKPHQFTASGLQDAPVYSVVNKGAKPTANGMQDGPVYSVVNKGAKQQTANQNIYSQVNKESPASPTTVYNLAKVLPTNEYYNSPENTKAPTAPIPPPQAMKPPSVSADEFGYSFVDSSPLPNQSPTSTPTAYSHLHQPSPSLAAASSNYCIIEDANPGPLYTAYEYVGLPRSDNKLPASGGVSGGTHSNTCSFLNLGQVNLDSIPGFNKRLPRVRGPVPMPQSWSKI